MLRFIKFFSLLLLVFSYSKAEELNTGNLVKPVDEWELYDRASSTQCNYSGQLEDGEVCTGHSDQGGTIGLGGGAKSDQISLIEQGLSQAEINQGITYNYGSSIESHISNTRVPSCSDTNFDCKDYFSIKLYITDTNGDVINTYEHTVEMDYSGVRDYSYQQELGTNSYSDILFQMDIWSVDAGYTSPSFYGGIISDPFLTVQYNTVEIITDIILDVVEDIATEDLFVDVVLEDYFFDDISFEIELPTQIVEVIEVIPELPELQEIQTEIQVEIQEQILEEMPELEEISNDQPEDINEVQPDSEIVEESSVEDESSEQQEEVQPEETEETRELEIKQKVAEKIMAKVDKTSSKGQATQVALMLVLSDISLSDLNTVQIVDREFYTNLDFYETQNIIQGNNTDLLEYMDYLTINKMVDSQWQN